MSKPSKHVKPVKVSEPRECHGCHKVKKIQSRGMCSACYMQLRRRGITAIDQVTELADRLEKKAEEQKNFAAEARRILQEGLPEAAMLMRRAAKKAAQKGNHLPAMAILEGTPVSLEDGSVRVFAGLPKAEIAQNTGPVINIGFVPGCIRQPDAIPAVTSAPAIDGIVTADPAAVAEQSD